MVVLSTADYDAPIWTNKQHLASRLALHQEVHFIDSLGLRRPRFTRADVQRIWRRIRRFLLRPSRKEQTEQIGPIVHSPRSIPFHGVWGVGVLNRWLLRWQFRSVFKEGPILWTFSPVTYGLDHDASAVVYHCVDLMHTFEGIPAPFVLRAEKELLRTADLVIASSVGVKNHLIAQGRRDVLLWENVADTALFGQVRSGPRLPRAIFAGNLTASKVDFELLWELAESGVPIVIAGPVSIDGGGHPALLDKLFSHRLVEYLGTLSPALLAEEFGRSKVGLIPYHVNPHTDGIFPMKVHEYLAAGLSVVATPIDSIKNQEAPWMSVVPRERFVNSVVEVLDNTDPPTSCAASKFAARHSWDSRIAQVLSVIEDLREGWT